MSLAHGQYNRKYFQLLRPFFLNELTGFTISFERLAKIRVAMTGLVRKLKDIFHQNARQVTIHQSTWPGKRNRVLFMVNFCRNSVMRRPERFAILFRAEGKGVRRMHWICQYPWHLLDNRLEIFSPAVVGYLHQVIIVKNYSNTASRTTLFVSEAMLDFMVATITLWSSSLQ